MKRHHIVAVIGGIVGVLLAIHQAFFRQQPDEALITLILVTIVAVSTFFKDKMYSSWRLPRFAYIVFVFVFILVILWIGFGGKGKHTFTQSPAQTQVSDKDGRAQIAPLEESDVSESLPTQNGMAGLLKSEAMKKLAKEFSTDGKLPEPLTSFSKFQEYLVEQGMTEYKDLDFTNHYLKIFQKYFPGKVPSDLDSEMKKQLREHIQNMGYEAGRTAFREVPENAIWLAARFDPTVDMGEALGRWTELVLADGFGDNTITETIDGFSPRQATVNSPSHKDTDDPIRLTQTQLSVDQSLDDIDPMETREKNVPENVLPPDIAEAESTLAEAESTFTKWLNAQDFETLLSEEIEAARFTLQQLNTALEIINRYGPEEGLRRIKESDPAVATHLERIFDKNRRSDISQKLL